MPPTGRPLVLYVPVHVDDGLAITNSIPLYAWFLTILGKRIELVDLGPVSLYLGMRITRDRAHRRLWISHKPMIISLLEQWNMLDAKPASIPMTQSPDKLPSVQSNSLPHVRHEDL